jgi:hypothetical protein
LGPVQEQAGNTQAKAHANGGGAGLTEKLTTGNPACRAV